MFELSTKLQLQLVTRTENLCEAPSMQNALRAAKAAARLPTKRIFAIRHARQTSVIAYVQRRAHLRCFASKGGNEDKTWGDIAGEAAVVAK